MQTSGTIFEVWGLICAKVPSKSSPSKAKIGNIPLQEAQEEMQNQVNGRLEALEVPSGAQFWCRFFWGEILVGK